jgi:hypothetical protein
MALAQRGYWNNHDKRLSKEMEGLLELFQGIDVVKNQEIGAFELGNISVSLL